MPLLQEEQKKQILLASTLSTKNKPMSIILTLVFTGRCHSGGYGGDRCHSPQEEEGRGGKGGRGMKLYTLLHPVTPCHTLFVAGPLFWEIYCSCFFISL